MRSSKKYYNNLASSYQTLANERIDYLNSVDNYILSNSKNSIENYLDVGSGDGRRSIKIAEALNVKGEITLVDNSDKMLQNLAENVQVKTHKISIFDFEPEKKYNLVTCMWNVLGHFPDKKSRITLFSKISSLLKKDGIFIFDVNNRYNISIYGLKNVESNIKKDQLYSEENGWFSLGKKPNKTNVFIHSPFDIKDYQNVSNFVLEETKYVDYNTGKFKETFFEGQLLYKFRKL